MASYGKYGAVTGYQVPVTGKCKTQAPETGNRQLVTETLGRNYCTQPKC